MYPPSDRRQTELNGAYLGGGRTTKDDRRATKTSLPFGSWAVSVRPLALRPRLAAGLPFREAVASRAPVIGAASRFLE